MTAETGDRHRWEAFGRRPGRGRGARGGRTFAILILVLAGFGGQVTRAADGDPEPLRVKLEIARGPHFVGQGILMTAGVIGEADRPKLDPPKVPGADVWPVATDVTPLSVSGIGDTIAQDNLFLTRFRLVPRRAGKLDIPPARAESAGRAGRSRPLSVTVQSPPIEGRPGSFLGGIGDLAVKAEAEPTTLRVGQAIEYRIRIDGPAAWGSTIRPDLGRFDRLPLGLRIEPAGDDMVQEPPSRTFTYRLRPTAPGEAALPAVLISAFDPKLGRYPTKATPSVPIRVVAVPGFDAKTVDYRPPPPVGLSRGAWRSLAGVSALLAGAAAAAGWRLRRRIRRRRNTPDAGAARRFAARTARDLGTATAGLDTTALARRITEALIRHLELGAGRPPGALTPAEAGRGVADITGSAELGDRAHDLLASCDRALYGIAGDRTIGPDAIPSSLHADARALFRELG